MSMTVARYLTWQMLRRFLLILLGFATLLQLFDVLSNAEDITRKYGEGVLPILRYMAFRYPAIVALVFPFTLLVGTLMTLLGLAQNNEIMALKSVGLSFYRVLLSLMPVGVLLAGINFALNDWVAPAAATMLARYEVTDVTSRVGTSVRESEDPVWIRDGSSLVRAAHVQRDGRLLWGVEIYERDAKGILNARIAAARGVHEKGGWRLYDVVRTDLPDAEPREGVRMADWAWKTRLRPEDFANISVPLDQFSSSQLANLSVKAGAGSRPPYVYETWLHKRLALPVLCLMMIMLAAPVSQVSVRSGGTAGRLAAGIGLGFLFFVTDGLSTALGETGAVAPWVAAWSPLVIFGSVGGSVLLRLESV